MKMVREFASAYVYKIELEIKEFIDSLEEDETFILYVMLNNGSRITATWFGFHDPSLVIVEGRNDKDQFVTLLLHMIDVQIVLIRDKKDNIPKRSKIGFQTHKSSTTELQAPSNKDNPVTGNET